MESQYLVYSRYSFEDRKKVGKGHFNKVDDALIKAIEYKHSHPSCKVYVIERTFNTLEMREREVTEI